MNSALYDSVAALRLVDGALREFAGDEGFAGVAESAVIQPEQLAARVASGIDELTSLLATMRRQRTLLARPAGQAGSLRPLLAATEAILLESESRIGRVVEMLERSETLRS
jgi:hypothetical protein